MTIERLTEKERSFFAVLPEHLGGIQMRKALRIIDAQSAEIDRLRSCFAATEVARLKEVLAASEAARDQARKMAGECSEWQTKAEARVRELDAADCEAAKCIRELSDLRDAAESECAALRVIRAQLLEERDAAESRLAAANALLGKIQQWECAQRERQVAENPWVCLMNELDTYLATKPVAPTRTERQR